MADNVAYALSKLRFTTFHSNTKRGHKLDKLDKFVDWIVIFL